MYGLPLISEKPPEGNGFPHPTCSYLPIDGLLPIIEEDEIFLPPFFPTGNDFRDHRAPDQLVPDSSLLGPAPSCVSLF